VDVRGPDAVGGHLLGEVLCVGLGVGIADARPEVLVRLHHLDAGIIERGVRLRPGHCTPGHQAAIGEGHGRAVAVELIVPELEALTSIGAERGRRESDGGRSRRLLVEFVNLRRFGAVALVGNPEPDRLAHLGKHAREARRAGVAHDDDTSHTAPLGARVVLGDRLGDVLGDRRRELPDEAARRRGDDNHLVLEEARGASGDELADESGLAGAGACRDDLRTALA